MFFIEMIGLPLFDGGVLELSQQALERRQLFVTVTHHSDLFLFSHSFCLLHCIFQAIAFVTFLVGFITVLCIGNYFRAKRAQERQRARREAKQAANQYATDHHNIGSYEAPAHHGDGVNA